MWFNIDFSNVFSVDKNTVTSTRTYVGPHIFTDGALEYSSFEGGYIDPAKGVMYYITDWQGNNAAVINKSGDIVQSTTYYPYGEPTIEPRGQRFLFGGKEREHAAGRNSYDFGARNLAANAWTTPDPLAEKFYPISPYSYCGGDPINNIDLWGMETLALSKNDTIQTYANNVQDDPQKLTVYSHGNYSGFDYDLHKDGGKVRNGSEFINAIKTESAEHSEIEVEIGLEIELKSCNAGADNPEGKPNIAKKISEKLLNAFVTGPNGRVKIHYKTKSNKITDLTETVLDKKDIPISGNNLTTTYFRGQRLIRHIYPVLNPC